QGNGRWYGIIRGPENRSKSKREDRNNITKGIWHARDYIPSEHRARQPDNGKLPRGRRGVKIPADMSDLVTDPGALGSMQAEKNTSSCPSSQDAVPCSGKTAIPSSSLSPPG